jgi:hypothetical protein
MKLDQPMLKFNTAADSIGSCFHVDGTDSPSIPHARTIAAQSVDPMINRSEASGLELFERARRDLEAQQAFMSADEQMQLLETLESSGLPASVKRQIGRVIVEHRTFKRGLVHYANPGNWYRDSCLTYWPCEDEGEELALEQYDVGGIARMILGIEEGFPSVPGFAIETAEELIVPFWGHDPGSIAGCPDPVVPEMFHPLGEDVELQYTRVYCKEESCLVGDQLEVERARLKTGAAK